jgi:hypothetical protein
VTAFRWKVPGRSIWCRSFRSWLRYTFWCHVVLRWYRDAESFNIDWRLRDASREVPRPKWYPVPEAVHEAADGHEVAKAFFEGAKS